MELLPISKKDVITPYNIGAAEAAELVVTSSNRAAISRRGGFIYTLTMGIRPYNLLSRPEYMRYWEIAGALSSEPYLRVPIFNPIETDSFKDNLSSTSCDAGVIGSDTITGVGTALMPGQFFKFSGKSKLYQVASVDKDVVSTVKLTKPLSHNTGTIIDLTSTDYLGNLIDGVLGEFVHEDFGNPVNRIEDGILGIIGPLQFKEKL